MENSTNYKLDKTAFKALSFEEADKEIINSEGLSFEERINQFNYLMSVAFGFLNEPFPRMDKTVFEKRKRS